MSALDAHDPRHGTRYAYNGLGCRCEFCTEVQRAEQTRGNHARRARLGDPSYRQPVHGTWSTYVNWMCRCDDCKAAAVVANARRAARNRLSP